MRDKLHSATYAAVSNLMTGLDKLTTDGVLLSRLVDLADVVANRFTATPKNKLLILGNGGSHCSALHIAEEFTGRFRKDRPPLPAIALGEATHLTCTGNDFGFDYGLARQLTALWNPGDVVLVLSTSGNSQNLLTAVEMLPKSAWTFGFLGKGGGRLLERVDGLIFPGETSDRIQELHMLAGHLLVELVERRLYPELYDTP